MIKNEKGVHEKKELWNRDWEEVKTIYFWRLRQHYFAVAEKLEGTVCDIGCGPGFLAGFVKPNESLYTGVDISQVGLDYGKMLFPASTFIQADMAVDKLLFGDNTFDTVVMSEIVEHLPDYSNLLSEARRISKNKIVITVPIDLYNDDHVWPIWTEEDIRREFSSVGRIESIFRDTIYNYNLVVIRK